jgi:hypothetical protein
MIREHDVVVLTQDMPDEGLTAGDAGTVIHVHPNRAGYEVEFMTLNGQTIAVVTVMARQVRAVTRRDIVHVRELAVA